MRRVDSETNFSQDTVFNAALSGDRDALEYVSLQAMGGNEDAKNVVNQIDSQGVRIVRIKGNAQQPHNDSYGKGPSFLKNPVGFVREKIKHELFGLD